MPSNAEVVPYTVNRKDCVLNVVQESRPTKKCIPKFRLPTFRLPTGDDICKFIIFLVLSGVVSLFAIALGSFAFVLFHGKDAETSLGICMLYGYLTLIIMFLVIILIICICCPNMGRPRMKGFK